MGLRDLAGREVTVELRHPLAEGHYTFFADPLAVGSVIAVKKSRTFAAGNAAKPKPQWSVGYAARMKPRLEAAFLVALGGVGDDPLLVPPHERQGRVTWALARFEVERALKGRKPRQVVLVGATPRNQVTAA